MLDEVARHLRSAKTVPTATRRSDLAEQTVAFLMSLFEFAASKQYVEVVPTLIDSSDTFGCETDELRQQIARELAEAKHLSARQERVITPTSETEIAAIVTHRLFRAIDRRVAAQVAWVYADYYPQCIVQGADLPQRALRARTGRRHPALGGRMGAARRGTAGAVLPQAARREHLRLPLGADGRLPDYRQACAALAQLVAQPGR